jgi:glycosyltransferase involved in cell wall biosynthesis
LVGPSWPFRGGIARTTTAAAATLDARGELAAFLTPIRQYPTWLYPGRADVDEAACSRLPRARAAFAVLEPWTWPGLRRALREAAPDAVVMPYWSWVWAPLVVTLASWRVAPLVIIAHNPADHGAGVLARGASRAVLRRAGGFLCHAQSVAGAVRSVAPAAPVRVHPLPPEAPAPFPRDEARRRLRVPADAVALLAFGLIRPYKGADLLLDAVAGFPAEVPLHLLLAGEPWGSLGDALSRRLVDAKLAGRVTAHLSWVPEDEARVWFAAADAAVLPYRSATGSAVAAQALGAGLPVVASRVGGLAEVVEDGANGLIVEPGDAGALASALARLCEPGLLARLADGARAASSRWTWASYAESLVALAGEVAAGGGGRPGPLSARATTTTPPGR